MNEAPETPTLEREEALARVVGLQRQVMQQREGAMEEWAAADAALGEALDLKDRLNARMRAQVIAAAKKEARAAKTAEKLAQEIGELETERRRLAAAA